MYTHTGELQIMQWNACSLPAHVSELHNYLSTTVSPPQVICVQETKLKEGKSFHLSGYDMVRRDRADGTAAGRVATFIKEGLNFKIADLNTVHECVAVEIILSGLNLTIINLYDPPGPAKDESEYKKLFLPTGNYVVTGDFNAHNPLWKSTTLDRRGEILEELIDSCNYTLINTGQPTYQKHQGGMTVLDLTFVSSCLASKCSWDVLNDTLGSDHVPTMTKINEADHGDPDAAPKWLLRKANWPQYRRVIEGINWDNIINSDINYSNTNIVNCILAAAYLAVPTRTFKGKKNAKRLPYWNEQCTRTIQQRNRARNKFNKHKTDANCIVYRRLKGIAQRTLKVTAREYWANYCNSLNRHTKLGSVWRMTKRLNGGSNDFRIPLLQHNNASAENNKDKAELLANTFANTSADSNYSTSFLNHKIDYELNCVL